MKYLSTKNSKTQFDLISEESDSESIKTLSPNKELSPNKRSGNPKTRESSIIENDEMLPWIP